jgi:biotin carboxyl carrier protein
VAEDTDRGRRELLRLADEVLPALIARLAVSELGELEVRDGDWRVRLRRARRPTPAAPEAGERSEGHRRPPRERRRATSGPPTPPGSPSASQAPGGMPPSTSVTGNGVGRAPVAVGPGVERSHAPREASAASGGEPRRVVARSPAVGYFVPRDGLAVGHATRSGDLLGHIDVLGVRQDVVSPADGVVGRLFVEPGEAVEYGQELLRVDPTMSRRAADAPA